jgi:hypothetical protein
MPQNTYVVKIIFEDKTLGVINDKINIMAGMERTFNIRKKKETYLEKRAREEANTIKGKDKNSDIPSGYVIRIVSANPIDEAAAPPPNTEVIVYQANPNVAVVTDGGIATTTTSTTTTTNSSSGNPDDVNVNMNVGVGGTGANINVNTNGMGGTSTTTTRTTTTRTTTTTNGDVVYEQPAPQERVVYVPGYDGPIGCPRPMNHEEFESAKASIASKSFEESKMQIAKQIVGANCCTAAQVKQIMKLFGFEQTKLDFAKFAYKYTYDQKNYYKVNDAFDFESSITELNSYLNGQ